MKMKRLFGVFLAFAMTLPLFLTGCQREADDLSSNTSIRQNIVLNMYILTEKETDPEQAKAVELALNEILLPGYRTVLKINYITDDGGDENAYWNAIDKIEAEALEYQEKLAEEAKAAKEAAKEANKKGGSKSSDKKTEEVDKEELEKQNESEYDRLVNMIYGRAANPDLGIEAIEPGIILEEPQLDIFVVNDPKKYSELANSGRLAPLDSYFTAEARVLSSYVYPTFLAGAKLGGNVTYGIPTNKAIGEYEYLVFDKELLQKYGYSAEDMKTLDSLSSYLAVIAANEAGVVPLALSDGGAEPQFFEYYNEAGSAIGLPSNQIFRSAFGSYADSVVKEHFNTVRQYRTAGYIPAQYTEGTRFAVDIRKGNADSPAEWSAKDGREYECVVYKKPVATNNNTLDSVFVVSAASRNPQRAAEIITLFNTVPQLANMLQYGIQGTNYYAVTDENGETKAKLPESNAGAGYYMNPDYTGNHYVKMGLEGEPHNIKADQKQNSDSIVSLYYGFEPSLYIEDELLLEKANEITSSYYSGLCRGDYDVETVYAEVNARLASISVSDSEVNAWAAENDANAARLEAENEAKEAEKEDSDKENDTPDASDEDVQAANSPFDSLLAKINSQFDSYYEKASEAHHAMWKVSSNNFNKSNGNNVEKTTVVSDMKKLVDED